MTAPRSWTPNPRCCWCGSAFQRHAYGPRSFFVCPHAACRKRQEAHALLVDGTIVSLPLPKQVELHEAVESFRYSRLYIGGALGGSKSFGIRHLAYTLCRRYRSFHVLLLRRTIKELEKHHILDAQLEQEPIGAHYVVKHERLEFPETDSFIQFGHCQHPSNVTIWLSSSYQLIVFDELPTFEEDQFVRIATRTGREDRADGWPGMVVAAGNPGGIWIEDFFITKHRDPIDYPDYDPSAYHFIAATLDDNPYLKPSYVNFLADLPKDLRDAWRWGSWDRFPDQFFKEFTVTRHVATPALPKTPYILGAMRWGYAKPGVFLWATILPDGRLHVLQQYAFHETVPGNVAQHVLHVTADHGWQLQGCWGHLEMGDQGKGGDDVLQTLALYGLSVLPSRHDPAQGWQRVHDWLQADINHQPALTIHPACEPLIRMMPRAAKDQSDPNLVADNDRLAAVHALRSLVMSQPRPWPAPMKPPYPTDSVGALFQEAQRDARRVVR